jgi:NADPH:quinone reductase-like Zn-dependent oxidoreductase
MKKEKRERDLLLLDAEKRYKDFLIEYPGMDQRIKQGIIASYLGIKPETLSRIRRRDLFLTYVNANEQSASRIFCSIVQLKNTIMNLQNNTVLITGGSSGIGLELSKVFIQKGNKVIICGRSRDKLNAAKSIDTFKLITYQCDLSNRQEMY